MHRRFGVVLDEELMPSSGSGPVWNVHCFGNEMTIAECVHGGWTPGIREWCNLYQMDVSIVCDNSK